MSGLLTLSGNPTAALHAATKQYVDTVLLRTFENRLRALEGQPPMPPAPDD